MIYNQTILHPVGLIFTILMAIILYRIPREYAILPILAVAFYLTLNLRIVILGLDFTMLRLMFFIGWVRMLSRSELRDIKFNYIDKIVILMVVMMIIIYTILWGTFGAFINRLGRAYDIASVYFISRALIRNIDDMERVFKTLLIMSIPISIFMINEQITGKNIFSIFGGVSEFSGVRDGKIRSQGAFAHAILAGNFGAALLPLVLGLWWRKSIKLRMCIVGLFSSFLIVVTSFSSGPLVAYLMGIAGLSCWICLKYIRNIIYGGLACLIALHLYMKAPVWALIMRVGLSGSDYHRFNIIDKTIKNFGKWWLLGAKSTCQWGYGFENLNDLANYYCRTAIDGGLIGLILFLMIIIYSFKAVEKAILQIMNQPDLQKFIFATGISLFVHTVAFFGVSYVGSNLFMLYMTLAILSTISTFDFGHERMLNCICLNKSFPQNLLESMLRKKRHKEKNTKDL